MKQLALGLANVVIIAVIFVSGAKADPKKYDLKLDGMVCSNCVEQVKAALNKIPSIEKQSLKVELKKQIATFNVANNDPETTKQIKKAIEDAGYTIKSINGQAPK